MSTDEITVDEALCDLDAERNLLGMLLVDPRKSDDLKGLLPDRDVFYVPAYGFLFDAIRVACQDASKAASVTAVCEALRDTGKMELAGGYASLMELAKQAPCRGKLMYAQQIAQKAAIRIAIRELAECADTHRCC